MTPLAQQLRDFKYQFEHDTPAEMLEVLSRSISLLQADNSGQHGLKVGDIAPDFRLTSTQGQVYKLSEVLKNGPCIVTFFRGAWCPYCVLELGAWQEFIVQNPELQLLAITPEATNYAEETRLNYQLNFPILTDEHNQLIRDYNLLWQLDDEIKALLHKWQIDLSARHSNQRYELPIPATFVIDQQRKVIYSFVEEDYTFRAEPQEVVSALSTAE